MGDNRAKTERRANIATVVMIIVVIFLLAILITTHVIHGAPH
jgi:hypothetical protein